ncbi:dehydrogenase [Candidatus Sumerlaeota bacterium]|nr:dehydrogenase [Candidatus Sumerlaeota bacterium]
MKKSAGSPQASAAPSRGKATQKNGAASAANGHNALEKLSARISSSDLLGLHRTMLTSRLLDDEEKRMKLRQSIYFQISGAGHEAIGVAIGYCMKPGHDWFYPYYRDRALCLQLGMTLDDHLNAAVGAECDITSSGRQMPNHWCHPKLNIVSQSSPTGTQYNQAVGCAEGGRYIWKRGLNLPAREDEVTLVTSGEGATAEGEFWEAINVASNLKLPVIFLIEDNEYAISVPVEVTLAGGNLGQCFSGMPGLEIMRCDGTDLLQSLDICEKAVAHARQHGPVLLHAKVTRPYSHSLSDDQVYYRTAEELQIEKNRDCITKLERHFLDTGLLSEELLASIRKECQAAVRQASERALAQKKPDASTAMEHLYSPKKIEFPELASTYHASTGEPLPMAQAINRTLLQEMGRDERILVFGEDVADATREEILNECKGKGGVFKVTYGLQREHGSERVYNTLLAEASIIGRSIGMAGRGLKPVPEIQFFDYIWPAFMQIRNELATLRYRSGGRCSAPVVIRVPIGGYLTGGSIYHSQTGESIFASCPGILIAYPSNAADAMGLLRAALRMDDPVLFLEHKHLYLQGYNRSADPGPDHILPFGKAAIRRVGNDITIITWGALVQKSLEAAERIQRRLNVEVEVIDIRTLVPLDRDTIVRSVRKTGRVLVAHEEMKTGGFGGEIAAIIAEECFEWLDAPVKRVASLDTWVAYCPPLEKAILPQTLDIEQALEKLAGY